MIEKYLVIIEKSNGLIDCDIAYGEEEYKEVEAKLETGDRCFPLEFSEVSGLFSSYTSIKNHYVADLIALDEMNAEFQKATVESYEQLMGVM